MEIKLYIENDDKKKLSKKLKKKKKEIDELKIQLNDEKARVDNLFKENMNLTKKVEELKLVMQQMIAKGGQNSDNSNKINKFYTEIDNLNKKLKQYSINLEQNEKLISLIFQTLDQKMLYSMICKNTDTISNLEEQLYEVFPAFAKSENIFLCKGTVIDKHKTFESYKIKNGDILILTRMDSSKIK